MPTKADTLKNGVPRAVLRSPAHPLMSSHYCLLEFTGRTTGRGYVVPVAYVERDDAILLSTDSRWWRNLVGGREFTVRLRGRRRRATATRITGPEAEHALRHLVDIPGYARAADIARVGGEVADAELSRAAGARFVLRVDLEGPR